LVIFMASAQVTANSRITAKDYRLFRENTLEASCRFSQDKLSRLNAFDRRVRDAEDGTARFLENAATRGGARRFFTLKNAIERRIEEEKNPDVREIGWLVLANAEAEAVGSVPGFGARLLKNAMACRKSVANSMKEE